nr:hypothetical protein [Tanacetum cinerariifolium]
VVTSDPLALVAEKTNVSKQKEKVVVSLDSEGSGADNFSELKKITALLVLSDSDESTSSVEETLLRKSMQTWSSWLKLKRFFQNQTKVLHLLKKPLL